MEALQIGQELVAGQRRVVDSFELGEQLILVTQQTESEGLSERQAEVCSLVAQGHADKWIGYELDIARSTVATHLSAALERLHLARRTDIARVWPVLEGRTGARLIGVRVGATTLTALVIPAAVAAIADLTEAENEVMTHAVRGASNAQIAEVRGTSARTVANQLASIYRKLGLCSRNELAAYVA